MSGTGYSSIYTWRNVNSDAIIDFVLLEPSFNTTILYHGIWVKFVASSFIYVIYIQHNFLYCNSSMHKQFHYWIFNFLPNPSFLWSKKNCKNWLAHGGISKIFFLHHFSSSFLGQKFLKFHPYSILTGETRVEFVIYCVLSYLKTWVLVVKNNLPTAL